MPSKFEKIEAILRDSCGEYEPLVFLHPDESRSYTDDELLMLRQRNFKTRLFISNTAAGGNSVFMRTHFTDNHEYQSHLNYVRDFLKATHVTLNLTAAKTTATELLSMFFALSPSEYYSFAVTVASGLSNYGENVSFEKSNHVINEELDSIIARRKLCLLMNILFSKVSLYRFLIQEDGNNTYRIVHCGTKTSSNKRPLLYAFFSFLLQFCLTFYVVAENVTTGIQNYQLRNLPLAIMTFIYSAMIALPGMTDSAMAMKLYGRVGLLQITDFFVNQFLTFVLLFSGFFVIMIQESYIEAVMNTAALLFIPEIDDQLPSLLGLESDSIIKNYLTYQTLKQFDKIARLPDESITENYLKSVNQSIGVPFGDYYLTNIIEQAANPNDGINFTPYQVIAGRPGDGHQIDPSNYVTENCLIGKLVWSYTTSKKFANTSLPRIGYLKIEKLNGETVEIYQKGLNEDIQISDVKNVLSGVFIITSFQMSDAILRLRVCGSPTARNFLDAFEYYSLWGLNSNAVRALESYSPENIPIKKSSFVRRMSDKVHLNYIQIDSARRGSITGSSSYL